MRFKALLEEKNLSIDQLPKGVQKKILDLEKIVAKVEEYKNSEEVDDEGLNNAESKINDLDRDIEKALLRFNPEIYQKRLDILNKIHKNNKKAPKTEQKVEPKVEERKVEEKISELKKEVVVEVESLTDSLTPLREAMDEDVQQSEESHDDEYASVEEKKHIEEELKRLKKSISHIENNTVTEELSKSGEAEPKKMSKGLILMGVGAFLLTWGAVNFFKERKG